MLLHYESHIFRLDANKDIDGTDNGKVRNIEWLIKKGYTNLHRINY